MPRPKRTIHAADTASLTPPDALEPAHCIAQIQKAAGNNLFAVAFADASTHLVQMPAIFRSRIWVKRGTYVVVNTAALADRDNKLGGEIVNIVRDERAWRRMGYWPPEFPKRDEEYGGSDGEEDDAGRDQPRHVGMMPPSDDDDDEP